MYQRLTNLTILVFILAEFERRHKAVGRCV